MNDWERALAGELDLGDLESSSDIDRAHGLARDLIARLREEATVSDAEALLNEDVLSHLLLAARFAGLFRQNGTANEALLQEFLLELLVAAQLVFEGWHWVGLSGLLRLTKGRSLDATQDAWLQLESAAQELAAATRLDVFVSAAASLLIAVHLLTAEVLGALRLVAGAAPGTRLALEHGRLQLVARTA